MDGSYGGCLARSLVRPRADPRNRCGKFWTGSHLQEPNESYPTVRSLWGGTRAFASNTRSYAAREAHSAVAGVIQWTSADCGRTAEEIEVSKGT